MHFIWKLNDADFCVAPQGGLPQTRDWVLVLWWYSPISLRGWQARLPTCRPSFFSYMTCLPWLFVIVCSPSIYITAISTRVAQIAADS